jgi:hypothetical protein
MNEAALDILLNDYEATREDLRSLEASRVNVIGFAIASISLLGVVVSRDCRIRSLSRRCASGNQEQIHNLLIAVCPVIPLALMAYLVYVGFTAVLKSFYARQLERKIRELVIAETTKHALPSPVWAEIEVQVSRMSTRLGLISPIYIILQLSALVVYGGFTAAILAVVPPTTALFMAVTYLPAAAVLVLVTWNGWRNGRRIYLELEAQALMDLQNPLTRVTRRANLVLLHVLPRRGADFLFKGVFILLGTLGYLAVASLHADVGRPRNLGFALLALLAFEFVLYQGRYLINDFRGFDQDRRHPDPARLRLPFYYDTQREALKPVVFNVAVRLALFCTLIPIFAQHLRVLIGLLVAFLFLTAAIYDNARESAPNTYRQSLRPALLIHVMVGAGYAARAAFGCILAAQIFGLPLTLESILIILVFVWVYGSFFVTLSYALDAAGHVDAEIYAVDSWVHPARIGVSPELWKKPHLAVHLHSVGLTAAGTVALSTSRTTRGICTAFLKRGDRRSPWRVVPSVLASIAALLWPAAIDIISGDLILVLALLGLTSGALIATLGTRARYLMIPIGCLAIFVALVVAWGSEDRPTDVELSLPWVTLLAVTPWIMVSAINAVFRNQSRYEQTHGLTEFYSRKLAPALVASAAMIANLTFGQLAGDAVRSRARKTP